MPGADGMSSKFMKNAFVGWTFTAGLYYPPDFDEKKLLPMKMLKPKGQKTEQALNIRMMFPFTMVCDTCQEYNYTGTKFTSKCEQIKSESYLGIKVYRFYGRCRHCWAEFTFKTDPKNSDYTMESGGKRTYEAWKDADMMESKIKEERERDAEQDKMKALEQKSIDVQAEMQRTEDLDAIRTMNKRLGAREQTIEDALDFLFKRDAQQDTDEKEHFSYGEMQEVAGFKEAQEEQKRLQLDGEIERASESIATSSTASGIGSSASALGSASPSASGGSASSGTSAMIAAAVAERASQQASTRAATVGARFSVKRAAPAQSSSASGRASASASVSDGADCDAKRPRVDATTSTSGISAAGTVGDGAVAASSGGGGIGLGAYDSDSS